MVCCSLFVSRLGNYFVKSTQPSSPLCFWQCFGPNYNNPKRSNGGDYRAHTDPTYQVNQAERLKEMAPWYLRALTEAEKQQEKEGRI